MLPSDCDHVLEEVPEEAPYRHTCEFHRVHHAQMDRHCLRALVAAVVLDHRERANLMFRKAVVYHIQPLT